MPWFISLFDSAYVLVHILESQRYLHWLGSRWWVRPWHCSLSFPIIPAFPLWEWIEKVVKTLSFLVKLSDHVYLQRLEKHRVESEIKRKSNDSGRTSFSEAEDHPTRLRLHPLRRLPLWFCSTCFHSDPKQSHSRSLASHKFSERDSHSQKSDGSLSLQVEKVAWVKKRGWRTGFGLENVSSSNGEHILNQK